MATPISRRSFLKASAATGGGLLLGIALPACEREAAPDVVAPSFEPNAWLRIGSDNIITIRVASSEMGQGVMTALPMLVAEELDADWQTVRVETAPVADAYKNPIIGQQLTGGSTAVRAYFTPLREAGASARDMLIGAAATRWGVPADSCRTENGAVLHPDSGRRAGYGELAEAAAQLPVPGAVILKDPEEFRYIGKPRARVDVPAKVDGSAVFGYDVKRPGMLIAVVARNPVIGAKVANYKDGDARGVAGVRKIVRIDSGVAVVADDFWSAQRGRALLKIQWVAGGNANLDSAQIRARLEAAARKPGAVARESGNVEKALADASKRVDAIYEVPYLAHACMEPMSCTVEVGPDGCDVWVPTQAQTRCQQTAAKITGLTPEQVRVHTTFLGGGFGRRGEQDFVAEAVQIAVAVGKPVKLLWTREEDMRHDYYRPATFNVLSAGLDKKGQAVAWRHKIVGPSIMSRVAPSALKDGVDRTSVEGAANLPYGIPNLSVRYVLEDPGLPVGFWRSVGSSQNAFITECFLDELAAAAGKDPYQFRRALLVAHPRHLGVLDLAADKAGWGKAPGRGRHRGIAVAESFGSYCAQVAEVSVGRNGALRVHRVVCAIDCGIVVNPDTVVAQMESAIVYGLSAALKGEITIKHGRVEQGNFDDYPVLRIDEMPVVEVHIVPSTEPPGGVGEPGTPPIAPAVANAVHAATGKPVRRLPIRLAAKQESS